MFKFTNGKVIVNLVSDAVAVASVRPTQQLLPAPRTEADQLIDFKEGLRKLDAAIQRNKGARDQLKEFQGQGTWDSFWGGLSGKNDKDLAKMLTEFGASLETTQSVVQLLTQMHTVNNNVLRGFNDALVREIERLQSDAMTLEGNQNGSLVVLYEFKHQIDELLALADGYEHCSREVERLAWVQNSHEAELKETRIQHDNSLSAQGFKIEALNQALTASAQTRQQQEAEFKKNLAQHSDTLSTQDHEIERLKKLLNANVQARESLSTYVATAVKELDQTTTALASRLESVEAQLTQLLNSHNQSETRIDLLEQHILVKPNWVHRVRQQAFALGTLLIATAALMLSIHQM